MTRKTLSFISPVLTSVLMLFPALGNAEFICSSDVSYKWVKTAASKSEESVVPQKESKEVSVTPTAAPAVPAAAPSQVRYASVERGGADEAAAKTALNIELSRQKARASERCKREHESFGECLATKLSVKGTVLNSLSFSARAQLEKALTEECQAQQGTCLSVESSEPACREAVKVNKSGSASPGAEAKSGDDSKKTDEASKSAEQPPAAAKDNAKTDAKGKAKGAKK
jgi:hypothetical protein